MSRGSAVLAAGLAAALACGAAWTIGFTAFDAAARADAAVATPADAIVVLTGGADRIETALRLLQQGVAPALLISGVGRGSALPDLVRHAQIDIAELSDRVTIGHAATSTVGNANETAAWARARGVHRLVVVTAGYHMPRALAELRAQLPEVALQPVPVRPPALRAAGDLGTLHLLANEYDKLLAARIGVSHWAGRDGA